MKKIFAIALALVMVLSMASAFASYCTAGFDWTCATSDNYCGKATVEVVPYVKTNAACNGSEFVESDCAAAINGENVYYAIKLTVAEDVDLEWWDDVKFELSVKGMTKNYDEKFKVAKPSVKMADDKSDDGWEFYYVIKDNKWYEATENDEFEIDKVMNKSVVKEFAKAKVCMTLKSYYNGFVGTVGEYWVEYVEGVKHVEASDAIVVGTFEGNTKVTVNADWTLVTTTYDAAADETYVVATKAGVTQKKLEQDDMKNNVFSGNTKFVSAEFTPAVKGVQGVLNQLNVYDEENGKWLVQYIIVDGKVAVIDYTNYCGEASYATIKDFFGLEIGTCVDKDLIEANFGWDEKVKSCYEWKTQNATAIVDTECVVAIPKTGDASVLAWLF